LIESWEDPGRALERLLVELGWDGSLIYTEKIVWTMDNGQCVRK